MKELAELLESINDVENLLEIIECLQEINQELDEELKKRREGILMKTRAKNSQKMGSPIPPSRKGMTPIQYKKYLKERKKRGVK